MRSWPTADPSVADRLRADLAEQERFRLAVQVDPQDGSVSNGMHRVAAAILERVESIDITTGIPPDTLLAVDVRTRIPADAPAVDDWGEALFTALLSFPVPDGWVTCETLGGAPPSDGILT